MNCFIDKLMKSSAAFLLVKRHGYSYSSIKDFTKKSTYCYRDKALPLLVGLSVKRYLANSTDLLRGGRRPDAVGGPGKTRRTGLPKLTWRQQELRGHAGTTRPVPAVSLALGRAGGIAGASSITAGEPSADRSSRSGGVIWRG